MCVCVIGREGGGSLGFRGARWRPQRPATSPRPSPLPSRSPSLSRRGLSAAGKGRGPGAQGAEEPGRGGTLPVAARRWGRRARRAARPRWAGQGRSGLAARGGAMRGARAAPFRPRPKLVLLPLLVLLCHRTRSQGEWWSELVSGAAALATRAPSLRVHRKFAERTPAARTPRRTSPGGNPAERGVSKRGVGGRPRGGSPRPRGGVEALGVVTGCGWQREGRSYAQGLGRGVQRPLPAAHPRKGPPDRPPQLTEVGASSGSGMCRMGALSRFPGNAPPPLPRLPLQAALGHCSAMELDPWAT